MLRVSIASPAEEDAQKVRGDSASKKWPKLYHRFQWVEQLFERLADEVTVGASIFVSYWIYRTLHLGQNVEYPLRSLGVTAFIVATLYMILLDREGAYRTGNSLLRVKETESILRVAMQVFLFTIPVTFFAHLQVSRWIFVLSLLVAPVMEIFQKQLTLAALRKLRSTGFGVKRVVIYGAGPSGRRVFSALVRSPKLGLQPVAIVDDDISHKGQQVFNYSYRRDQKLDVMHAAIDVELLTRLRCEFLILATENLAPERIDEMSTAAREAGARLGYLSTGSLPGDLLTEFADLDGMMLKVVGKPERHWSYEAAKRPYDLVFAGIVILFGLPALLVVSLMVALDSPGPIFFRQTRVGLRGKPFRMFKVRTMHTHAPKYGFSPKGSEDPRITRVGRILRRTSLDELPQLINVLRGEMSLVGPRPEMPFIVEQYTEMQKQRLAVRPGITGLWQLSADRSELIHENIQYDLYYISNRSFFMDCAILIHTLLFAMRGV